MLFFKCGIILKRVKGLKDKVIFILNYFNPLIIVQRLLIKELKDETFFCFISFESKLPPKCVITDSCAVEVRYSLKEIIINHMHELPCTNCLKRPSELLSSLKTFKSGKGYNYMFYRYSDDSKISSKCFALLIM